MEHPKTTLAYLARPIDFANDDVSTMCTGMANKLVSALVEKNIGVYEPAQAFTLPPVMPDATRPDTRLNDINNTAVDACDIMIVLWPEGSKSWGVPAEVAMVAVTGRPVLILSGAGPLGWAAQYDNVIVIDLDGVPYTHRELPLLVATEAAQLVQWQQQNPDEWIGEQAQHSRDVWYKIIKSMKVKADSEILKMSDRLTHPVAYEAEFAPGGVTFAKDVVEVKDTIVDAINTLDSEIMRIDLSKYAKIEGTEHGVTVAKQTPPKTDMPYTEVRKWPAKGERQNVEPTRAHVDDAGLDIYVSEDVVIQHHEFVDVPSNMAVTLPPGTWGMLTGRSSTLRKKGLLVNQGIIDTGYTGELFSGVWNLSDHPVTVKAGERIAQLVILPNLTQNIQPVRVESFESGGSRGGRGFGSSGL